MRTPTRISPRDHRRMPWRNGGGTTSEILAEPGPGGRFRFRLSVAEVAASGPFSDFAGYERHILLLAGEGFTLHVEGRAPHRIDRPLVPFAFDGGARVRCELLGGPVRDLNLMVDRDSGQGGLGVLRLRAGEAAEVPLAGTVLLYLVEGVVDAGVALAPGDTLRADGVAGDRLALRAGTPAVAVLATVGPTPPLPGGEAGH